MDGFGRGKVRPWAGLAVGGFGRRQGQPWAGTAVGQLWVDLAVGEDRQGQEHGHGQPGL